MPFKKRTSDTRAWLWGEGLQGQLGDDLITHKSSPVQTVAGGTDWKQLMISGRLTSMGIKNDGTLWTWGYNNAGQLGDNSVARKSSPVQTAAGGNDWLLIAPGYLDHSAVIKTDGSLWMWGLNTSGQLGDNTIINKSSPVQEFTESFWRDVSTGDGHTVAIKTDGTLWGMGANGVGQLGDNSVVPKSSPIQTIAGGTDWKQVASGERFAGAIKTDGSLWMWGLNNQGRLGDNTLVHKSSPVQTVAGGNDWKQFSCHFASAAVKTDGTLWTWGHNATGGLGDNTTADKSSPVQEISNSTNWKHVSAGLYFTSAIKTDGTLWSWGSNQIGQLGDNTVAHKSSPVQTTAGGTSWISVASGRKHIAAIQESNVQKTEKGPYVTNEYMMDVYPDLIPTAKKPLLWGCGYNVFGSLGDNSITNKSSPVQTVAGGSDWKYVACGYAHSAAVKTDGTLWMWGYNANGQLGDNSIVAKSSPVQTAASGTDWTQGSAGQLFAAAIKTDGTLWTWGNNTFGQLGDNSTAHKSSPVQTIAGGTDWTQVSAGQSSSAAIKTDGTLWTWGYNTPGTLGDNTTLHKSSPVQTVAGGSDWKQVNLGADHLAAIKTDGTLWMCGYADSGALGDNTVVNKSSPVQTITGGSDWKTVQCGYVTTAAIKTDGTLWGWGYNGDGRLGDNSTVHKSSPVQTVAGGTNWKSVACSYQLLAISEGDDW